MNALLENDPTGVEARSQQSGSHNITRLPDSCLISRVRGEPINARALDELLDRHWKPLVARCRLLTRNSKDASALAQAACVRLLQRRKHLHDEDDFRAHLIASALAIWRLRHSLPSPAPSALKRRVSEAESGAFSNVNAFQLSEAADLALRQLTAFHLDIVLSLFVDGESKTDVALRYRLSEQDIEAALNATCTIFEQAFPAWSCSSPAE
jgi:DNA-directed RNA polymerase specialized sigma24 family protein